MPEIRPPWSMRTGSVIGLTLFAILCSSHAHAQEPVRADRVPYVREARSPAIVWLGIVSTAALGAVSVWSLVDTLALRDDYAAQPSVRIRAEGVRALRRTWALSISTAVFGLGTLLLSALHTRWRDQRPVQVGFSMSHQHASLSLTLRQ